MKKKCEEGSGASAREEQEEHETQLIGNESCNGPQDEGENDDEMLSSDKHFQSLCHVPLFSKTATRGMRSGASGRVSFPTQRRVVCGLVHASV